MSVVFSLLARGPSRLAVTALVLAAPGCATYEPHPLDLDAHRSVWEARSPEQPEVAQFAARLADRVDQGSTQIDAAQFDPEDGVSLAEAEVLALFYNAELRRARAELGVARAALDNAGRWMDPVFGFSGGRVIDTSEDPWLANATLSFTLPISGTLDAQVDQAADAERAELTRVLDAEWRVRTEVRAAWSRWTTAVLTVQLEEALVGELDSLLEIVATLERSGELGQVQAGLLRLEQITRKSELADHRAEVARARLALNALLGFAPEHELSLLDDLAFPKLPDDEQRSNFTVTSLVLAVAQAEYSESESALATAVAQSRPDLTITPNWAAEDGLTRLLLGASLPLMLWNRNARAIAVATAARTSARVRYETRYEELRAEIASVQVDLEATRARRQTFRDEVAPLVDEHAATIARLAELGEIDPLTVLEVLKRRHAAQLELVRLHRTEARLITRIQRLIGPCPAPRTVPSDPTSTNDTP